jgi:hypothetical protein
LHHDTFFSSDEELPLELDELLSEPDEPFAENVLDGSEVELLRLSVQYHPEPLNTIPTL